VCFGTRGGVLCKSGDVKFRMLSVCIIQEEKRKVVYAGSRDIYTRVPAISSFNLYIVLVNDHKTVHLSSCRTTRHLMNDKAPEEIQYSRRGHYTTRGVGFATHNIFTAQTLCISEQIE